MKTSEIKIQVRRIPWHALSYDASAGVLELSVGARGRSQPVVCRHEIHDPKRLWVEEEAVKVRSISIEHPDGVQTIFRFHEHQAPEPGT